MAQVFHVLRRMDELGCDLFLDIHGDEEIAANFLAGSEGVPSWNEAMAALAKTFMTGCARARTGPSRAGPALHRRQHSSTHWRPAFSLALAATVAASACRLRTQPLK